MTLQYRASDGALLYHESDGALMAECCCCDDSNCPCYCPGAPEWDPYKVDIPFYQLTCDCEAGGGPPTECQVTVVGGWATKSMAFNCEGDDCGAPKGCYWYYGGTYNIAELWWDTGTELWNLQIDSILSGAGAPPDVCSYATGAITITGTLNEASFNCDTTSTFAMSGSGVLFCVYGPPPIPPWYGTCTVAWSGNVNVYP